MSDTAVCPRPGRRRFTTLAALVALLAGLLSLTGAGTASAADPACAPLALAPPLRGAGVLAFETARAAHVEFVEPLGSSLEKLASRVRLRLQQRKWVSHQRRGRSCRDGGGKRFGWR